MNNKAHWGFGSSSRQRCRVSLMLFSLLSMSAACSAPRISSSVTCDALRQLHLGMDRQQVMQILGPPVEGIGEFETRNPSEPNEFWSYHDNRWAIPLVSDLDRFDAYFRDGKLVEVRSYRKPPDGVPQPRLFDMSYKPDANGQLHEKREEGKLFEATFCPDKAKTAKG